MQADAIKAPCIACWLIAIDLIESEQASLALELPVSLVNQVKLDAPHTQRCSQHREGHSPHRDCHIRPGSGKHASAELDNQQRFYEGNGSCQPCKGAKFEEVGLSSLHELVIFLGGWQGQAEPQQQPQRVQWVKRRHPKHELEEECVDLEVQVSNNIAVQCRLLSTITAQ